jgi:hypothetical protein
MIAVGCASEARLEGAVGATAQSLAIGLRPEVTCLVAEHQPIAADG